jgi:hypothetical protein
MRAVMAHIENSPAKKAYCQALLSLEFCQMLKTRCVIVGGAVAASAEGKLEDSA